MPDLWLGLERNDFSKWPSGIFARAFVRDYAKAVGLDADEVVDEFCRLFPHGDRRAARIIKAQAELIGHSPGSLDDPSLVPRGGDRRTVVTQPKAQSKRRRVRLAPRTIAATIDVGCTVALALLGPAIVGAGFWASAGVAAIVYYSLSTILSGATLGTHAVGLLASADAGAVRRPRAPRPRLRPGSDSRVALLRAVSAIPHGDCGFYQVQDDRARPNPIPVCRQPSCRVSHSGEPPRKILIELSVAIQRALEYTGGNSFASARTGRRGGTTDGDSLVDCVRPGDWHHREAADARQGSRRVHRHDTPGNCGALVGGFIGRAMGFYGRWPGAGWLMSILGAMILLALYRMLMRRGSDACSNCGRRTAAPPFVRLRLYGPVRVKIGLPACRIKESSACVVVCLVWPSDSHPACGLIPGAALAQTLDEIIAANLQIEGRSRED